MKVKTQYTRREFERLLLNNNYYFKRHGKGSHDIWTNGNRDVTVPRKIHCMLAKRIIYENALILTC